MPGFYFDPEDPEFIEDPYPFYRQLRDEAPAYRDEDSGLWFISRYADIERATTDYEIFSSAGGNAPKDSPLRVGKTLGSLDPPRHDELRRVIQRSLAPSRIDAILPIIRESTKARLAAVAGRRECDLVADIGRPVLFGGLALLLGLDEAGATKATELLTYHRRPAAQHRRRIETAGGCQVGPGTEHGLGERQHLALAQAEEAP